jgi:hypothetical protein
MLDDLAWTNARKTYAYGIGVQFTKQGAITAFGHEGDVAGYRADVRFNRANKTGVIALRNVNGAAFALREFTHAALEELPRR